MRIEVREHGRRLGRIIVDPARRPTRVELPGGDEAFLDWETALDDAGHLRRCVACGSELLYRRKVFPQVTGLVVVMAFAAALVGLLGYATTWPVLAGMGVVLALDIGILLFARTRLVCYGCRSSYHEIEIARYHRPWDRGVASRLDAATLSR